MSSLNSVASTSFNNGYAQRPSGRPLPTPQVSYSGFDAPMYSSSPRIASGSTSTWGKRATGMSIDEDMDMDDQQGGDAGYGGWVATGFQPLQYQQEPDNYDMSTSVDLDALNQMSPRSRSRPRAAAMLEDAPIAPEQDDFSAFASDAFAPIVQDAYSSSVDSNRPGSRASASDRHGIGGGGGGVGSEEETEAKDGWEAFRRHNKAGASSAFAITPTNRTAPGSPTVDPTRRMQEPPSPWSGRLRNRPSGPGSSMG